MGYSARNFAHLLAMKDFSETMLHNHFTLYQGYVHACRNRSHAGQGRF